MENQSFEELKDIIRAGCVVGNSVAKSLEDGEFTLSDSRYFIDDVQPLIKAANGFNEGIKVFAELTEPQRKEVRGIVVETIELEDDAKEAEVEKIAIDAFMFVQRGFSLYKGIAGLRK